jgi:uncharacterized protein (TIGR03435 family)
MQPSFSQRRKGIIRVNLRGITLLLAIVTCAVRFAHPQPPSSRPPAARLSFEVASVRLNVVGGRSSSSRTDDQVSYINYTLKSLIEEAYYVQPFQVAAPAWLQAVRADVTAKYPPGTKPKEVELMLRELLAERFKLTIHRETKVLPGYALVVAKGGFKLKPAEPGEQQIDSWGRRVQTLSAQKATISALADEMTDSLGAIVIDKTGISGVYDFELRWARDDLGDAGDVAPSMFTAFQDTLGLQLRHQKFPTQIVVVDHIERTPTEN